MKRNLNYEDLMFTLGDKKAQWLDGYRTKNCPQSIMFTEDEYKLITEVFNNISEFFERIYRYAESV